MHNDHRRAPVPPVEEGRQPGRSWPLPAGALLAAMAGHPASCCRRWMVSVWLRRAAGD